MANNKRKEEEVVLNLDTLGVPIAILVSVLLLAGLVYLASRNGAVNTTDGDTEVISAEDASSGEASVSLGDDPYLGDLETATVAIVDFSDYNCGYCERHKDETLPDLVENYVDTGKVVYVFKEFPLSPEGNIGYTAAAMASCVYSLSDIETYDKFHSGAFFLGSEETGISLATDLGVNVDELNTCMDNKDYLSDLDADYAEGSSAGVTGTPGFIVGTIGDDGTIEGELIAGAYPYDTFVDAIEKLLEE